jgi:predicted transcriptional regulator YdeE
VGAPGEAAKGVWGRGVTKSQAAAFAGGLFYLILYDCVVQVMGKLRFTVIEMKEDRPIYGCGKKSNDRTQAKDIPALSKTYYEAVGKAAGEVLPFYVISQDYDERTKDFQLFIGGLLENEKLETLTIPKGMYGKVTVKPRIGLLWGLSIGEAKRAFYTQWLPGSKYLPLRMEYEYHTEMSKGKNPQIEILFAVQERA